MKIVSEDANTLVATDKAVATIIVSFILGLVGIAIGVTSASSHQTIGIVVGAGLFAVAALLVLFHKVRTLTVDKAAQQVIVNVKTVHKNTDYPYSIHDVTKIQLATSYSTTSTPTPGDRSSGFSIGSGAGNTETTQNTQLLLCLANGTTIDISDGQRQMQSFGIFGSVPNQDVGQRIATFIGVPFEAVGSQSATQIVGAITNALQGKNTAPSVVPPQNATPVVQSTTDPAAITTQVSPPDSPPTS